MYYVEFGEPCAGDHVIEDMNAGYDRKEAHNDLIERRAGPTCGRGPGGGDYYEEELCYL